MFKGQHQFFEERNLFIKTAMFSAASKSLDSVLQLSGIGYFEPGWGRSDFNLMSAFTNVSQIELEPIRTM